MSRLPAQTLRQLVLAGLLAAAIACDRSPPPAASGPGAEVALRVGGAADLRETIARHRGKVVLVDFWATWCAPCVKLFPHTVDLFRQHAARGLAVVSVSLDDPAQQNKVLRFLREKGAAFDNIVSRHGLGAASVEEFDLRGDVPLYRLYDRAGVLRFQFSGAPDGLDRGEHLDRMDDRVRELLDEK